MSKENNLADTRYLYLAFYEVGSPLLENCKVVQRVENF